MKLEILIVSVLGIVFGILIAYILSRLGVRILTKEQKSKNKIINNPDLLLEKLNNNGIMIDYGEELKYGVIEKDGGRRLDLKKEKLKVKEKRETAKVQKVDDKKGKKKHRV